jgi:hypothetical protein
MNSRFDSTDGSTRLTHSAPCSALLEAWLRQLTPNFILDIGINVAASHEGNNRIGKGQTLESPPAKPGDYLNDLGVLPNPEYATHRSAEFP